MLEMIIPKIYHTATYLSDTKNPYIKEPISK